MYFYGRTSCFEQSYCYKFVDTTSDIVLIRVWLLVTHTYVTILLSSPWIQMNWINNWFDHKFSRENKSFCSGKPKYIWGEDTLKSITITGNKCLVLKILGIFLFKSVLNLIISESCLISILIKCNRNGWKTMHHGL